MLTDSLTISTSHQHHIHPSLPKPGSRETKEERKTKKSSQEREAKTNNHFIGVLSPISVHLSTTNETSSHRLV